MSRASEVYRLMSELICVFVNARPNTYGPIPEDSMCIAVLASLANLQHGNERLTNWKDIQAISKDAIAMLSNETPSMFTGDTAISVNFDAKKPPIITDRDRAIVRMIARHLSGITLQPFPTCVGELISKAIGNQPITIEEYDDLINFSLSL